LKLLKIWPNEDWRDGAICATIGGDWWYPEKGENTRIAREICAMCPVKQECLDHAMKHGERQGIWGGVTAKGREQMRTAINAAKSN